MKIAPLAVLLAALEQQRQSEQWQTPKLIPLMTTWLNQERWRQELPAPTVTDEARRKLGPSGGWECPHVEPCTAPGPCAVMTRLGRPERAGVTP